MERVQKWYGMYGIFQQFFRGGETAAANAHSEANFRPKLAQNLHTVNRYRCELDGSHKEQKRRTEAA